MHHATWSFYSRYLSSRNRSMFLTKTCMKIHGSFPWNSPVLVRPGCYNKTPWTGDLQTRGISHTLKGGGPSKSESSTSWSIASVFPLCSLVLEEAREPCGVPFIRTLIPLTRTSPSWPKHLSKAPSSNTIVLGIRFQHVNLGWGAFKPQQTPNWKLPPMPFTSE